MRACVISHRGDLHSGVNGRAHRAAQRVPTHVIVPEVREGACADQVHMNDSTDEVHVNDSLGSQASSFVMTQTDSKLKYC